MDMWSQMSSVVAQHAAISSDQPLANNIGLGMWMHLQIMNFHFCLSFFSYFLETKQHSSCETADVLYRNVLAIHFY